MLNISKVSIKTNIDKSKYSVFELLEKKSTSSTLIKIIFGVGLLNIFSLFLPWTQNIRTTGYVTTLNPYDKPQSIQSILDGQIEEWYVMEGDTLAKGDTILKITEIKSDYLDPNLISQTENQRSANEQSVLAYNEKANNLSNQVEALIKNKATKTGQNKLKIDQAKVKIGTLEMEEEAASLKVANSRKQQARIQDLYDKGIKSLTDLEIKNFSLQEAQAKLNSIQNKITSLRQELEILELNNEAITNEFDDKIAKARSERMTAISSKFNTQAKADKLQSQINQYEVRKKNYYLRSPINGIVTKTKSNGIGETIKAGQEVLSMAPVQYQLAVETYIKPRDMPLLEKGQRVMIQFDGWPAIVFSGWPGNSFGTFHGKIFAIDNFISDNGLYRILVEPDQKEAPWPKQVRVGGGSNSLILLNEVPLYYEIWRVLNGFPPDFYKNEKMEKNKAKAPIKKIK